MLILDESHYVKNHKTRRWKALRVAARKATHVFLLSGTPTPSRVEELWAQLALIDRQLPSYWHWTKTFCGAKKSIFGWDVSGATNIPRLKAYLRDKMVRRKKSMVLTLPEKVFSVIPVKIRPKDQEVLWQRWQSINKELQGSEDSKLDFERKRIVSDLYHMSAHAKVDVAKKIVLDLYNAKTPFVAFAFHRVLLDAVSDTVPCIRIDGDTKNRQELVDRFQDGTYRCACLSIKAAGCGLTLTAATIMVFLELSFSPGEMRQCEDRIHRLGQKHSCSYYYLICTKFDDWQLKKIQRKEQKLFI